MSAGWIVVDLTARPDVAVLRGRGVPELAARIGARPMWIGTVRGWQLEPGRVGDLLALLQHLGVRHRVIGDVTPT